MAGTVKLPGIGNVKSTYVWGGAAVVAVIVGVAWYRHEKSASAAAASSASSASSAPIDPETGYPEGSPEDEQALAQLQETGGGGYASDTGDTGAGGAGELYYDPADGLYDLTTPYQSSTSSTSNTGPGTFTSNAYWVQYAIQNIQGYSASDIQTALALYLAGQGLTTTQMSIYQAALAVAGPPPEPPATSPHLASGGGSPPGPGTGTTPPTGTVTVPDVVGLRTVAEALPKLQQAGLVGHIGGGFNPKATDYVTSQTPGAGKQVAAGSTVDLGSGPNK
jgi:PASTA domain